MLVYNKYLKELGYKKSDFRFKGMDHRYKLNKDTGVVEAHMWSLYNTLLLELYTYIRNFQDEYMGLAVPGCFFDGKDDTKAKEEWYNVVQKIIDGIKAHLKADGLHCSDFDSFEEYTKAVEKLYAEFDEAWRLLGEYLSCFWY